MPRGGSRKGTPGTGYSNRTDLTSAYDNTQSAAAGPAQPSAQPMVAPGPPMRTPDDSPMLTDPTQRPNEPVTTGLNSGPGAGREALNGMDPRVAETQKMKKWLPILQPMINDPETPESVKLLFKYVQGV